MLSKSLRLLHITPWWPSADSPSHGVWIKRQIGLLSPGHHNHVLHIDADWGKFSISTHEAPHFSRISIRIPIKSWRLREYIIARELRRWLKAHKAAHSFNQAHFHIAYPHLIHFNRLKKYLPTGLLIVEHWSAYRFNFNSTKSLNRIRSIFAHALPVAAVSQSLINDIKSFSKAQFETMVLPNVVDTHLFRPNQNVAKENTVLMAGIWKEPKDPESVVADFLSHAEGMPQLRIAGSGVKYELLQSMASIADHSKIAFLGQLTEQELASELQRCKALLLPTKYETFSVIAAEAAACGLPVITRNVGALPEVLSNEGAYYLSENELWTQAVKNQLDKAPDENRIAAHAQKFSTTTVREIYLNIVERIENGAKR